MAATNRAANNVRQLQFQLKLTDKLQLTTGKHLRFDRDDDDGDSK